MMCRDLCLAEAQARSITQRRPVNYGPALEGR
jgi:hypothetical protein